MERLKTIVKNLTGLDLVEEVKGVVNEKSKELTGWITDGQLYKEGIRGGDGLVLASKFPYKPLTIQIKQAKGQPTDRVTLRDTGDFHRSFKVQGVSGQIRTEATDRKTLDLMAKYGDGILAFSDENVEQLKKTIIIPHLVKKIKEALTI